VLIEGHDLLAKDENGLSDPYVKFKLGNERYKSKYKNKTLNPKWLEQFDLYMYDDQPTQLDINVFDHDSGGRDEFVGRNQLGRVDIGEDSQYPPEVRRWSWCTSSSDYN
jgi:Ca2+-dependent lipid-binding protein